jgi:hypothetical protein
MSLFHLARKPPAWLRVALVGLLLAFALDSIAHVVHRHDASVQTSATHGPACGYCAAFDGLHDAPKHRHAPPTTTIVATYVAPVAQFASTLRPRVTAQPRAPPR